MSYDIKHLLDKHKEGTLTPEEEKYLFQWYNLYSNTKEIKIPADEELAFDIEELQNISFRKTTFYSYKWIAVAVLVLVVSFCFYFLGYRNSDLLIKDQIVSAGIKKAELILHTGEKLAIDSMSPFTSIVKGNVKIEKQEDGTLKYLSISNTVSNNSYDQLITSRANEYKVQLVDGTKVWLNANSKLRFFTNTVSNAREVWLEGEAYFDVKKDFVRPFIVHTDQQEIVVTGTEFNVRCDQRQAQTTLIEGGVKIDNGKKILTPNEQLTTRDKIHSKIISVDVEDVIAWKKGYLIFNDMPLSEVIAELEVWYDIEFYGHEKLKDHKIWATISKYKDLDEVLKVLQMTDVATFYRKGRRVEIRQ